MPSLAGKPPYATDEPDSFYESPKPTPRQRPPPPQDNNKRTSAYDVYDNYLSPNDSAASAPPSRNSGVGALGMGLLNMDDSDDDDDDDGPGSKTRQPASPPGIPPVQSKHAALAAAISAPSSLSQTRGPPAHLAPITIPSANNNSGNNNMNNNNHNVTPANGPTSPGPGLKPIAAPRPGYAAPIAALNLARPEPTAPPPARMPQAMMMPNPHHHPHPQQQDPFANPPRPAFAGPSPSASPAPSMPHPLQPPVTPITPVFIRPTKVEPLMDDDEKSTPGGPSVKFKEGSPLPRKKPIMRSNSEDPLLPNRGEKGDDFWRRFSMVAKTDTIKNESSWLKSMRSGSSRHSRWVWCAGLVLLLLIAGGVGAGVYFTRGSPDNQPPTVLGGDASAKTAAGAALTKTSASAAGGGAGGATGTSKAIITPTHTIDTRSFPTPVPGSEADEGVVVHPPMFEYALRSHQLHAKRRLHAH